jgi:benzoyl-CoA reductase/2-hydroxyglutaryl-CoA dehydratase subunit BcrC/BadD/HgdB
VRAKLAHVAEGTCIRSSPASTEGTDPLSWFGGMVDHCYDFAEDAKANGRPIVGIMCEFTPREVILAAGGVPVCLCGGSAAMVAPAEQVLPVNLCPLIKSTFGYHLTGKNPFLAWADLLVAETTCDGKKKMFELMAASKPMHLLELPQKSDETDSFEHWVLEVRKLLEHLASRFHVEITDAALVRAIKLMNRERRLRRQLADLMVVQPPPLTGRQLLEFKSLISGIEADLVQYERAVQIYSLVGTNGATAHTDATRNTQHATRITHHASPVRVLLTGVPLVHGAERVLELIEACGAVVVCMENCTGLRPILEDVDLDTEPDPIRAIARKYYHLPCSVMTPNPRRLESLRALTAKFRPQCVIELVWQACLTYDVESYQVRKLVEEDLHLPYLKITTDYSPSDSLRISARIEALLETVQARAG